MAEVVEWVPVLLGLFCVAVVLFLDWRWCQRSRPHPAAERPGPVEETASDGAAAPAPVAGEVAERPGRARRAAPLDLSHGHLSAEGPDCLELTWFDSSGATQWQVLADVEGGDRGAAYVSIFFRCPGQPGGDEWLSPGSSVPASVLLRAAWLVRDIR